MNDIKVFKPNYRDAEKARIPNMDMYKKMYDYSVKDPEGFGQNRPNGWTGIKSGTK